MESPTVAGGGRISEITAGVLLVVLVAMIMKTLAFMFIPLSVALLFCYALGMPLDFLKRLRVPGFLRIIAVVLFVTAMLYLLGRLVQVNVLEFKNQMPEFEYKVWNYSRRLFFYFDMTPEQGREMIAAFLKSFEDADLKPLGDMAQQLGGSFFSFLGNVIWVLLFMVFILTERDSITQRVVRGLGSEKAAPVLASVERINKAVQHYLGLKTLVSLITGVLVSLTLWWFGVHFALLWGVLAFLLNFVPNIGSLFATVPPVIIALFQFGSLSKALIVAVLITGVQMVVGNILEPRIMGKGLNLSPLLVLLALVFWGWMWGLTGMLLSVPLTAAIKIGLEQLESTHALAILMSAPSSDD